jgi:GDPmannose 4,6-dehydratase
LKVLIFGAGGQDGFYLSELHRVRGDEVIGVSRSEGSWMQGDVSFRPFVEDIIREQRPDVVFHLAAHSTTRHDAVFEHQRTIGEGTLNVLEAVKRWNPQCKVFIAGSGLQFVNRGMPIRETDPFDHTSGYAVARNYAVQAARYYRSLGLRTYVGYLFHHESPRRKLTHVSQIVAQAARRVAEGDNDIISVGDISVRKEWTFAGDVAKAMALLVAQDVVFEAVIGSGNTHSIEEWLQACFEATGHDWREHVHIKSNYAAEYPVLVSAPQTIKRMGWRVEVDLADLATMMVFPSNLRSEVGRRQQI